MTIPHYSVLSLVQAVSFSRQYFWHLCKISFWKFEANQFWQTTNVCGKIRKIGVNFGSLLLVVGGHFVAAYLLQTKLQTILTSSGLAGRKIILLSLKLPIANWFFISFAHFIFCTGSKISLILTQQTTILNMSGLLLSWVIFIFDTTKVELIEINVTRLTNSRNYENYLKQEENSI